MGVCVLVGGVGAGGDPIGPSPLLKNNKSPTAYHASTQILRKS